MTGMDDERFDRMAREIQAAVEAEALEKYSKTVMKEFNDPHNFRKLEDADGLARIKGSCGDTMKIYLKASDGKITDLTFMTDGCGSTIACGSALTRMLEGWSFDEARAFTEARLIEALDGLPDENLHCAKLAVDTLHKALDSIGDGGKAADTHTFRTSLAWEGGRAGRFTMADRPFLEGATPTEFGGPDGYWNPEELFVGSYELCLMTTFLAIIERFRVEVAGYESRGEGTIVKGEKYYSFSGVTVDATIKVRSETDVPKVEKAVEVTKKACFVSNSLSCDAQFNVDIQVEPEEDPE